MTKYALITPSDLLAFPCSVLGRPADPRGAAAAGRRLPPGSHAGFTGGQSSHRQPPCGQS